MKKKKKIKRKVNKFVSCKGGAVLNRPPLKRKYTKIKKFIQIKKGVKLYTNEYLNTDKIEEYFKEKEKINILANLLIGKIKKET